MIRVWNRYRRRRTEASGVFGKIRIHPLSFLLILLACGVGLWRDVVILFILVMLHELGHAAAAYRLGCEVESVSLLPFGGVAKMSYGKLGFEPKSEALIAIAGPLVNVALIGFALLLSGIGLWSHAFALQTIRLNAWIAIFNLLPVMPLDGGRILRAARSRACGFEQATREAYRLGIIFACALLLLGVTSVLSGNPHFGLIVLSIFLLVSAWVGQRTTRMELMRFLDAKRRRRTAAVDEVRSFVVPEQTLIRDIVTRFGPDRYHLVYVVGDGGDVVAVVPEDKLLEAVFQGQWLKPLTALR